MEIIRWAKAKGWNVTAEACPHHLLLTDDLAATYDPIYKVNPPLRTAADAEALRAGLADGTIDIVATDHAPHPHEDKDCEWAAAAFGMLGLETALSIVQETMVDPGLLDWADVAERMSYAPARIGRVADHGQPARGRRARPTWCSTTRRYAGWSTPPSRSRCRATRRTPGWSCPAASSPRSCAAGHGPGRQARLTTADASPGFEARRQGAFAPQPAGPAVGPLCSSSRTAVPSAARPTAPRARPSARRSSTPA